MKYIYNIIILLILNYRNKSRNEVFSFVIVDNNSALRKSRYQQRLLLLPHEKKAKTKVFLNSLKYSSSSSSSSLPSSSSTVNNENKIEINGENSDNDNNNNDDNDNDDDDDDAFILLSSIVYNCLKESDKRRDAKQENNANNSPAGATNWIDEKSAFLVQQVMNKISLKLPEEYRSNGYDRDEASIWLRWLKLSPTPLIIDISKSMRDTIIKPSSNILQENDDTDDIDETANRLNRITCTLYLLPSGMKMSNNIITSVGSMYYGKLLYGGIKRYRILNSSSSSKPKQRRSAERIAIKSTIDDNIPCWIQYGGTKRNYESVDIGPACILEIGLLPLHSNNEHSSSSTSATTVTTTTNNNNNDMNIDNFLWKPKNMFHFHNKNNHGKKAKEDANSMLSPSMLSGSNRNEAFATTFESRVGGLHDQIEAIVRRVLDGRVIRPVLSYDDNDNNDNDTGNDDDDDEYFKELKNTKLEADELSLLGLSPVKGLLLYGPPGCGKTILAREISYALQARKPKIVSAPELLDRWVGGSEKLIRDLFSDAEAELASVNGDASKSALHVIVIDEIDAVFRKRSSSIQQDSGEATRSSAVNQILAKLDGVNAIPNVLLIGMTNRRELLDEALIRPGRLEVQICIPLPDKEGRRDILKIHFDLLRKKGRLSLPLCMAIDGPQQNDFITNNTGANKKRKIIKQTFKNIGQYVSNPSLLLPSSSSKKLNNNYYNNIGNFNDLALDLVTGGFSGADIAGLVRCAGSIALARARNDGSGIDGLLITLEDVMQALKEVKGI